jgi:hypothetical protein
MEGILRSRFAPFCSAKKSTDSKPDGLPSVALAKDGGGDKRSSNRVRGHNNSDHPGGLNIFISTQLNKSGLTFVKKGDIL